MNQEQRDAIWLEIGREQDQIERDSMMLRREVYRDRWTDIKRSIDRRKENIRKLKEGL